MTQLDVARKIIRAFLDEGYELAYHDGEALAVPRTRNFDALNQALQATDEERLIVYRERRVGAVLFVGDYDGVPDEVVCDHTDVPAITDVVDAVLATVS